MKKLFTIFLTFVTSVGFVRTTFIAAGVGVVSKIEAQAPQYITFTLGNGDTLHGTVIRAWNILDTSHISDRINERMSISTATDSINAMKTTIAARKNISDSGRGVGQYTTGYDLNKVRDSLVALIPTSTVSTSRTISTTSPLTGGGDLSANRTFAINNAAADNSTKGAATFDSNYFDDNGSGLISWAVSSGTGSISTNAVTINFPRGKITYASPSIAGAGTVSVTFTNSFITATSIINIGLNGNGSNLTLVNAYVKSQTAGSCIINIQNLSLLSLFNTGFIIDYFIVN